MFAQEQLETAEKYKQLQIEKEKYKTLLEEKQLNGEELTAEEQQDLSSLDGEIEKYKTLEEETFKQAALSQKRAQASRDAADEAKKELEIQQEKTKKDKTTLKGMKTKSDNAKKQYDLAKKEAEAARGRLKTADEDIKNKKNALALAEKEKETAIKNM